MELLWHFNYTTELLWKGGEKELSLPVSTVKVPLNSKTEFVSDGLLLNGSFPLFINTQGRIKN